MAAVAELGERLLVEREDEVRLRLDLAVEVVGQRRLVERDPGAEQVLLQHRLGRDVRDSAPSGLRPARCACRRSRSRLEPTSRRDRLSDSLYENLIVDRWTSVGAFATVVRGRAPPNPHRSPAGSPRRRLRGAGARGHAGADAERELQRTVQFTAHGPVVLHVITAPRPGGLYQLKPLLSNGAIVGHRARDLDAEGHLRRGHGRGRQRRPLQLQRRPPERDVHAGRRADEPAATAPARASASPPTASCSVGRVVVLRLLAGPRPAPAADRPEPAAARRRHLALHAGLGRRRRRSSPGVVEVVLQPFPPAVPGTDLTGVVTVRRTRAAALAIPHDGAVLLARGSQVAKLQAEAPPGERRPDAADPLRPTGSRPASPTRSAAAP